jgi:hypothetical protein
MADCFKVVGRKFILNLRNHDAVELAFLMEIHLPFISNDAQRKPWTNHSIIYDKKRGTHLRLYEMWIQLLFFRKLLYFAKYWLNIEFMRIKCRRAEEQMKSDIAMRFFELLSHLAIDIEPEGLFFYLDNVQKIESDYNGYWFSNNCKKKYVSV